jgi:hypothetical protein
MLFPDAGIVVRVLPVTIKVAEMAGWTFPHLTCDCEVLGVLLPIFEDGAQLGALRKE